MQWARTLARVALGASEKSPFVVEARGTSIQVRFERPMPYELDGGVRKAVTKLKIHARPGSVTICVPPGGSRIGPDAASLEQA